MGGGDSKGIEGARGSASVPPTPREVRGSWNANLGDADDGLIRHRGVLTGREGCGNDRIELLEGMRMCARKKKVWKYMLVRCCHLLPVLAAVGGMSGCCTWAEQRRKKKWKVG